MTDSDVLMRAAKALREAHDGRREGSGFTRARVMNTLHRDRRRRILRWAIASPLASVLLVGSAWAQSSGKWPEIWQTVTSVFVAAPRTPEPPVHSRAGKPVPRSAAEQSPSPQSEQPDAATPQATPLPAPDVPVEPPEPSERSSVPSQAPSVIPSVVPSYRRAQHRKPRPPAHERAGQEPADEHETAPPSDDTERAPDRELSRFRAAHDLHFSGDRARDAIAAYEQYLREFPSGRFVPEARYNIALDHIKLGDKAAARAALAPFAEGRFGTYRQKEAAQLLEALH